MSIFVGLVSLVIVIFLIGWILPKERVVTCQSQFSVAPEVVYSIVTNNEDWKYRSNLKELIPVSREGEYEIWDEVTTDGAVIRFTTKEKRPCSHYSFAMESKMFTGHWIATFAPMSNGGTLFTATEHISIRNPFVKTLSYLFFNIKKLMNVYQDDLRKKIASVDVG